MDQLEKMEAKLEDTEKKREKLAAELRPVLLQVSCEQKAKAATELQVLEVDEWQVGQLQQQLAEEGKKGKALLDQLQNMEAKLVHCE